MLQGMNFDFLHVVVVLQINILTPLWSVVTAFLLTPSIFC